LGCELPPELPVVAGGVDVASARVVQVVVVHWPHTGRKSAAAACGIGKVAARAVLVVINGTS
jgi:hypothetical protein